MEDLRMKLLIIYCSALLIFFSSIPAFSTMIEKDVIAFSTNCSEKRSLEHTKVQEDVKSEMPFDFSGLSALIKMKAQEKSESDDPLKKLNGRNLSHFPLSKEMYEFIEQEVGSFNKRPFVFKTGPQIIFEDEIDLSR